MPSVLDVAGLSPDTCAGLLGINPRIVKEWAAGQSALPPSVSTRLAAILGLGEDELEPSHAGDAPDVPAVWFKFRGPGLSEPDRECVFLVRQLALHAIRLEAVRGESPTGWETLFRAIREAVSSDLSPKEQGRVAARVFRSNRGLDTGQTASGDVLRGQMRNLGIVVVESPLPTSAIEGFAFVSGRDPVRRPCVYANSYSTTWFRRNVVLAHELCHLVFDADSEGASVDLAEPHKDSVAELRAEAFALESLLPKRVLLHLAGRAKVDWRALDLDGLARLVATTEVEQRAVLRAAKLAEVITAEQAAALSTEDVFPLVSQYSDHALTASEFIKKNPGHATSEWRDKRNTTIPPLPFRLPVGYVRSVVEAERACEVSPARAAALLMIDEGTYRERFKVAEAWGDE